MAESEASVSTHMAARTAQEFADLAMGLALEGFVAKPRNGAGRLASCTETKPARSPGPSFGETTGIASSDADPGADFGAGPGQGVSLLFDSRSECIATFAHERIEQYPKSGGPSTDRRSIHAPELIEWSIALLKNFTGKGSPWSNGRWTRETAFRTDWKSIRASGEVCELPCARGSIFPLSMREPPRGKNSNLGFGIRRESAVVR